MPEPARRVADACEAATREHAGRSRSSSALRSVQTCGPLALDNVAMLDDAAVLG